MRVTAAALTTIQADVSAHNDFAVGAVVSARRRNVAMNAPTTTAAAVVRSPRSSRTSRVSEV